MAGSRRRFLAGAASAAGMLALPAGWLGCLATPASEPGPQRKETDETDGLLVRAAAWLWSQQARDGSFASAQYGLLSSGQSLTPFSLESLIHAGEASDPSRSAAATRAFAAMIRMRDPSGGLGLAGPSLDYPCYATGLLLSCLGTARPEGWREMAAPSVAWLRGQQLRAADGWTGHPAQGGWGMGDRVTRRPPNAGHVDLSMTRRVVEGLRAVGVPRDDAALREARDFVARCQTPDGSFLYSPVELALNKGLRAPDGSPLGYGSATTDGLLAMSALGVDGAPLERALDWLKRHHRADRNPGLDGGPMEAFAQAMRGYYRAGSARCFARFGGPPGWREELAAAFASEQREDGSFVGTSPLQKEDDPLVATAFAVQALGAVRAPGSNSARSAPLARPARRGRVSSPHQSA